jgi:hypothetical protein
VRRKRRTECGVLPVFFDVFHLAAHWNLIVQCLATRELTNNSRSSCVYVCMFRAHCPVLLLSRSPQHSVLSWGWETSCHTHVKGNQICKSLNFCRVNCTIVGNHLMLSVPGEIPTLSWPSVSDLSLAACDAVLCGRDITTLPLTYCLQLHLQPWMWR